MKSGRITTAKSLGGGAFRVVSDKGRSAVTGRFVTKSAAKRNPKKTIVQRASETSSDQPREGLLQPSRRKVRTVTRSAVTGKFVPTSKLAASAKNTGRSTRV